MDMPAIANAPVHSLLDPMMMSDYVRLDPEKSILRFGGGWMQSLVTMVSWQRTTKPCLVHDHRGIIMNGSWGDDSDDMQWYSDDSGLFIFFTLFFIFWMENIPRSVL
jgi:hypothetical protein